MLEEVKKEIIDKANEKAESIISEGKKEAAKIIQEANEHDKEYRQKIKEEGEKRGLTIADIFPMSQTMTNDTDYVSDGLHPSTQSYVKWEKIIFPVVFDLLKTKFPYQK